ncbi:hypothetical protein ACLESD_25815 [Pyxidicoccus sp. 3LFB2]
MLKLLRMGLVGLLIGSGAAVATATLGGTEASAPVCCSDCEPLYEQCLGTCGPSHPDWRQCRSECEQQYLWCSNTCGPCGPGWP